MTQEMVRESKRLQERAALLVYSLETALLELHAMLAAGDYEAAHEFAAALAAGVRRRRGSGLN